MTQKTAIIYLRVSSVQQARKELPVESQLQYAQAKAKDLGAVVVAIFTDNGISGRSDKRVDFQEAIAYCEANKPDYFIAWDTARFARNRIDAALYKRDLRLIGTDVVYVSMSIDTKTDEGWFVEALLEVMDESTSRRISKDTKRSMMKNAEEGYFNGGRVPFGYQTLAEGNRKKVVVRDDEAVIVREMFALCQRGMGALSIAVSMNNAGHSHRGRPWAKSTVITLLKNQTYIGYTIFNRRKHHSQTVEPEANWIKTKSHPAIIEESIFMDTQRKITARAPVAGVGSPKSGHLFTGMLKCGACGSAMHIESATGRSKQYFYYRCGEAKRGGNCEGRRLSAPEVDDFLAQTILNKILTPARVSEIITEIEKATGHWWKDREQRRESIVAEIRAAEKKRKNLFSVLELHGIDAPNLSDITVRLREIKGQIEALEASLIALESARDPELDISQDDIAEATEAIRAMVISCDDPTTVRTFFSSFVNKVVMEANQVTIEYDPAKIMNHGISVVHNKNMWLPEQVLLRTVSLRVKLPDRLSDMRAA